MDLFSVNNIVKNIIYSLYKLPGNFVISYCNYSFYEKSTTNIPHIIILTSCEGVEKDKESGTDKTVFRYNESAGISTLDPAFVRGI